MIPLNLHTSKADPYLSHPLECLLGPWRSPQLVRVRGEALGALGTPHILVVAASGQLQYVKQVLALQHAQYLT